MVLNTDWAQVEVIDLINDGSGLAFGIIGGRSTGVVVKTIVPGGVADRDGRLQSGDHILQIGEVNLRGLGSEQVASVLRQCGVHVRMVVARPVESTSTDYQALGSHAPIVPTKILGDPVELDKHLNDNGYGDIYAVQNPSNSYAAPYIYTGQQTDVQLHSISGMVDVVRNPLPIGSPPFVPTVQATTTASDMLPLDMALRDPSLPETETFSIDLLKDELGLGITVAGYVCEKEEISGIFVKSISKGSAADLTGKIKVNDRIIMVNGESVVGYTNHQAVEVLRKAGVKISIEFERYLRGPKYEQLQQAILANELRPTSPSSPTASSLPKIPLSLVHMSSLGIEPEGESRTSFDFDSAVLQDLETPTNDVNEIVIETAEGRRSVQFSVCSHESIYEKWRDKLREDVEIVIAEMIKEASSGLGISLEGTVDVEDGKEVRPHHYIRNILPNGPVGKNATLQSGDELLEVNGIQLLGLNHLEVVSILKQLPSLVILVCARYSVPTRIIDTAQHREAFQARNILSESISALIQTSERLVKAKSDSSISSSVASETCCSVGSRSKSLEIVAGLPMWSDERTVVILTKGDHGLGFSILDYQDPLNPQETVIVIRSLVPGGVAQQDGRLIPGDRLLAVNDIDVEHASLDRAVQILKGAPKGSVKITVAKPLSSNDTVSHHSQDTEDDQTCIDDFQECIEEYQECLEVVQICIEEDRSFNHSPCVSQVEDLGVNNNNNKEAKDQQRIEGVSRKIQKTDNIAMPEEDANSEPELSFKSLVESKAEHKIFGLLLTKNDPLDSEKDGYETCQDESFSEEARFDEKTPTNSTYNLQEYKMTHEEDFNLQEYKNGHKGDHRRFPKEDPDAHSNLDYDSHSNRDCDSHSRKDCDGNNKKSNDSQGNRSHKSHRNADNNSHRNRSYDNNAGYDSHSNRGYDSHSIKNYEGNKGFNSNDNKCFDSQNKSDWSSHSKDLDLDSKNDFYDKNSMRDISDRKSDDVCRNVSDLLDKKTNADLAKMYSLSKKDCDNTTNMNIVLFDTHKNLALSDNNTNCTSASHKQVSRLNLNKTINTTGSELQSGNALETHKNQYQLNPDKTAYANANCSNFESELYVNLVPYKKHEERFISQEEIYVDDEPIEPEAIELNKQILEKEMAEINQELKKISKKKEILQKKKVKRKAECPEGDDEVFECSSLASGDDVLKIRGMDSTATSEVGGSIGRPAEQLKELEGSGRFKEQGVLIVGGGCAEVYPLDVSRKYALGRSVERTNEEEILDVSGKLRQQGIKLLPGKSTERLDAPGVSKVLSVVNYSAFDSSRASSSSGKQAGTTLESFENCTSRKCSNVGSHSEGPAGELFDISAKSSSVISYLDTTGTLEEQFRKYNAPLTSISRIVDSSVDTSKILVERAQVHKPNVKQPEILPLTEMNLKSLNSEEKLQVRAIDEKSEDSRTIVQDFSNSEPCLSNHNNHNHIYLDSNPDDLLNSYESSVLREDEFFLVQYPDELAEKSHSEPNVLDCLNKPATYRYRIAEYYNDIEDCLQSFREAVVAREMSDDEIFNEIPLPVKSRSAPDVLDNSFVTLTYDPGPVGSVRRKSFVPGYNIQSDNVPMTVCTNSNTMKNVDVSNMLEKHWGPTRVVTLERDPQQSLGISIVGGKVDLYHESSSETILGIFIKNVVPDSPAGRYGELKTGDRILEVSGFSLKNISHEKAVGAIKYAKNPVTLVVQSLIPYSNIETNDVNTNVSPGSPHPSPVKSASPKEQPTDQPKKTLPTQKSVEFSELVTVNNIDAPPERQKTVESSEESDDEEDVRDLEGRTVSAKGQEIDRASAANMKRTKEEIAADTEPEDDFGYTMNKVKKKYTNLGHTVLMVQLERSVGQGLGLSLAGHKDRNCMAVFVCGINPAGAAHRAGGIQVGDEILEVNGVVLHGRCHLNASAIIKGLSGPVFKLIILRRKAAIDDIAVRPITQFPVSLAEEASEESFSNYPNVRTISIKKGTQSLGIMIIEGKHAEVGQGIFISDIQEGSSAEKAGLEIGEMILAVNKDSLLGSNYDTAANLLKRTEGLVTLVVSNPGKKAATPTPDDKNAGNRALKAAPAASRPTTPIPEPPADPTTGPIAPGRDTTIEIISDNKTLGLCFVGGKDTPVVGGIIVVEVYPGGAAEKDGRLQPGDQILDVNGTSLKDVTQNAASQALRQTLPKMKLIVYRSEKPDFQVIDAEFTKKPGKGMGLSVVAKKSGKGVYVSEILNGGCADVDGKIMRGDLIISVNGQNVDSSSGEEAGAILKTITGKVNLKLHRYKPATR